MPAVRVATLNLLNNAHGRWTDRQPLVIDQAVALAADIYAFQEVDQHGTQIDDVRAALGDGYRSVVFPNPDAGSIKSLAVVTRLGMSRVEHCTTLEQGDIALRVRLDAAGRMIDFATTHFHFAPSKEGSARRERQARQLLEWQHPADRNGTAASIIAGDFNSRPSGAAIATMKTYYRSAHEVANGSEPDVTHPTPLVNALDARKAFGVPKFPDDGGAAVDFIFVGPGIRVRSCTLAWTEPAPAEPHLFPSDHFGLVADLEIE